MIAGNVAQAAAGERIHLIEVIYEIDVEPLAGGPVPSTDPTGVPNGYFVQDLGAAVPVTLHAAIDGPLPGAPPTDMWAGLWFRSHLLDPDDDPRALEAMGALPWAPDFRLADSLVPAIAVELLADGGGGVVATVGDLATPVAPRSWAQAGAVERIFTRAELHAAMVEGDNADDEAPSADAIDRELDWLLGVNDSLTLYTRILVVNHGMAVLAGRDLLTTWREARRLSQEGPYEDALAELEVVLDVLPRHAGAGRLFAEVFELVEAGAVPAHVTGRLAFPDGQPDATVRSVWERYHGGYAVFASVDGAPGPLERNVPIKDGGFGVSLPSGAWRLTLVVPGFSTVELDVTADGETAIDIPLVPHE